MNGIRLGDPRSRRCRFPGSTRTAFDGRTDRANLAGFGGFRAIPSRFARKIRGVRTVGSGGHRSGRHRRHVTATSVPDGTTSPRLFSCGGGEIAARRILDHLANGRVARLTDLDMPGLLHRPHRFQAVHLGASGPVVRHRLPLFPHIGDQPVQHAQQGAEVRARRHRQLATGRVEPDAARGGTLAQPPSRRNNFRNT